MPLDKYDMYLRASTDVDYTERRSFVVDTSAAIGGAFSKGGVADYINKGLSGD